MNSFYIYDYEFFISFSFGIIVLFSLSFAPWTKLPKIIDSPKSGCEIV